MNKERPYNNIRALVETSLLVAIGFVLSYVSSLLGLRLPQGGSFTLLSMLPILTIGLRHGLKWGLGGGFVFACLQMLQEFWPPPTATVYGYIAVVMLDYIVAFTVLGLSGFFRGKRFGLLYATPLCLFLRFASHFVSGVIIWNIYAGELPVWLYSLTYNGSFMGFELVTTMAVGAVLCKTAPFLFNTEL
jgi:thiamine transporter